jgi:hypothetical protein
VHAHTYERQCLAKKIGTGFFRVPLVPLSASSLSQESQGTDEYRAGDDQSRQDGIVHLRGSMSFAHDFSTVRVQRAAVGVREFIIASGP